MRWLTEDLPGTGGRYKETPEDFQVEEIPLYPCSGSGEHLYLWVEKAGITTRNLLAQLARGLRIKEREIGYAGLKDARALTRQMVSVSGVTPEQVKQLELEKAQILAINRHGNKLRLGHLAGNRFTIRLRDTHPEAAEQATAILNRLQQQGVPNLFGEQRYGILGNSARLGRLLLQHNYGEFCRELLGDPGQIRNPAWQAAAICFRAGDLEGALAQLPGRMRDERRMVHQLLAGKPESRAVLDLPRNLLRLFLSAAQSELFDLLLRERLPHLGLLEDGDVAIKHANGACFRVTAAAEEQPRADAFEISPTAPLYGKKVMRSEGEPGEREMEMLKKSGIELEDWEPGPGLAMPGERRALRVPLADTQLPTVEDGNLTLSFILPKGSYATSVLDEVMKCANSEDAAVSS
ncbi:MAG: tRNA pseudouridine(13) synthase TruD [Desulfuromonas sp.]|nr:MAG: tRNA pseudouridine(13) synthase TruD [Desulfuromonas sp.]